MIDAEERRSDSSPPGPGPPPGPNGPPLLVYHFPGEEA